MKLKIAFVVMLALMVNACTPAPKVSVAEQNKAIIMRSETELWSGGNFAVAADSLLPQNCIHLNLYVIFR